MATATDRAVDGGAWLGCGVRRAVNWRGKRTRGLVRRTARAGRRRPYPSRRPPPLPPMPSLPVPAVPVGRVPLRSTRGMKRTSGTRPGGPWGWGLAWAGGRASTPPRPHAPPGPLTGVSRAEGGEVRLPAGKPLRPPPFLSLRPSFLPPLPAFLALPALVTLGHRHGRTARGGGACQTRRPRPRRVPASVAGNCASSLVGTGRSLPRQLTVRGDPPSADAVTNWSWPPGGWAWPSGRRPPHGTATGRGRRGPRPALLDAAHVYKREQEGTRDDRPLLALPALLLGSLSTHPLSQTGLVYRRAPAILPPPPPHTPSHTLPHPTPPSAPAACASPYPKCSTRTTNLTLHPKSSDVSAADEPAYPLWRPIPPPSAAGSSPAAPLRSATAADTS